MAGIKVKQDNQVNKKQDEQVNEEQDEQAIYFHVDRDGPCGL